MQRSLSRLWLSALSMLLVLPIPVEAQMSEGGLPPSFQFRHLKGSAEIPAYHLRTLSRNTLLQEDVAHPVPFRYAVFEDVSINLRDQGVAASIADPEETTYRVRIVADSALSLQLLFSSFNLPPGARLYIYDPSYRQILGAFTRSNADADNRFVVSDLQGNEALVEYVEPAGAAFPGSVIISAIGKAYRDIFSLESGTSYININCTEGRESQTDKHAVCKMTFKSGSYSYLCSGSLINNVRNNGTPYFLTASHCINDTAEAKTLVAYFNYENEGCSGTAYTPKTLSGASLVTTGASSDYTLLRLNTTPPSSYQPYYAGWDAENTVTGGVKGIHHPEGLTKKISIDYDSVESNAYPIPWEGSPESPVGSHWQVNYDLGITAGGSSGSPLFNSDHQVIGQLHGGDDIIDLYGKFSYSFTHPSGKYATLKSILDPDNSGTKTLSGYAPAGNAPDAFLGLSFPKVCLEAPVTLTDYSAFPPYNRTWRIYPSTYRFAEGFDATSANPVVEFLSAGVYSVSLTVSNASGIDSMRFNNALRADNIIDVGLTALPEGQTCLCDFKSFQTKATGATSFAWEVADDSKFLVYFDAPTGESNKVRPLPGLQRDSSITVNIRVIGTQGGCADTATLAYNLIRPANDNISKAVTLNYGKSASYSNTCATVEDTEPIPPHFSCTNQYSWCDEYGTGENIVENSVWFRFVAGEAGHVSISSSGFDNEIALYRSESADSLLAGNYTFIAANDDRSSTDYTPIIKSEPVVPGKTYWIQVDGSGGGTEGNFTLLLTDLVVTGITDIPAGKLLVYPQPVTDQITLEGTELGSSEWQVTVLTVSGTLLEQFNTKADAGKLSFSTRSWDKGVYVARISREGKHFVSRIVKY
jgi:V8-like Glu-specific endopeptidase